MNKTFLKKFLLIVFLFQIFLNILIVTPSSTYAASCNPIFCSPELPVQTFCSGNLLCLCVNGELSNDQPTDCSINGNICDDSSEFAECKTPEEEIPPPDDGNPTDDGKTDSVVNYKEIISNMGLKPGLTSLGGIITAALPIAFTLAGMALLVFLIIGGFQMLTGAGDPKKTEAAQGTITAAIIGFVIIIAAYWMTQIINYIFNLGAGV